MHSDFVDISVVIPSYYRNSESLDQLSRCLSSISNQLGKPREVIVCDDSSEDNHTHILQLLDQFNDLHIRYFRNSRVKGVSGNTNSGIMNSESTYTHVLHQDDSLLVNDFYLYAWQKLELGANWVVASGTDGFVQIVPKLRRKKLPLELLLGVNQFGSPSSTIFPSLTIPAYDENLTMYCDIDFYFFLFRKYGSPKLLNAFPQIGYGVGEYQVQKNLSPFMVEAEIQYLKNKYEDIFWASWIRLVVTKRNYELKKTVLAACSDFNVIAFTVSLVFKNYLLLRRKIRSIVRFNQI